ncbi:hypothetical protein X291_01555 [Oenococcus oeni IOEB_C23]|uniref:restriction endonuclease PLD domain-containing protein n=1 Tax=Oenococcus oeni TaxID=1247 RepID=UPI00050EACCF|nr:restriction endonuclease PLD domain-containing protein [Oenococcus oeni]KGH67052.1 hypothetical protein X291_01555 [Oenococcus oeni IOEB_C23]
MGNLYSNVPPISQVSGSLNISEAIEKYVGASDKLQIAVGYVSTEGLTKLDRLIHENKIKDIQLVIGMYKFSGIPESIYNKIVDLHSKWVAEKIGKIYLVNNMNYHGKLYTFWHNNRPFKSIIGSANLGVLSSNYHRQYEVATTIEDSESNLELARHIEDIVNTSTDSADCLSDFKITHERIEVLNGIEGILEITDSESSFYKEKKTSIRFELPIKAPDEDDKSAEKGHFLGSNINVCYGKGRLNRQKNVYDRRNWYEAQITVSKKTTTDPNYPKNRPFYVITDDDYKFLAHTTADNNKQLTAYGHDGNDRVFGKWIKGRLTTAGLVKPFDNVNEDIKHEGVVTKEILQKAHMSVMVLTKTTVQEFGSVYPRNKKTGRLEKSNPENELLDVWTLSFKDSESE